MFLSNIMLINLKTDTGISVSHTRVQSFKQIFSCPISHSRSDYNYLLAVRFTVTASENFSSFTQSKGLKASSAQFILHWWHNQSGVTTAKQENESLLMSAIVLLLYHGVGLDPQFKPLCTGTCDSLHIQVEDTWRLKSSVIKRNTNISPLCSILWCWIMSLSVTDELLKTQMLLRDLQIVWWMACDIAIYLHHLPEIRGQKCNRQKVI